MLNVYDLRCEHEREPFGVIAALPRFSWKLSSDRRDVVQKTYRIEVATDPEFHAQVWSSGVVNGSKSHLAAYSGTELAPATRYYFRVQAGDNHGDQSGWSKPSWFETALPVGGWASAFIGMDVPNEKYSSRPIYLRREFTLAEAPQNARVYATALGVYELYLNGKRVGDAQFAPGWTNYRERLAYQTYDVTSLLVKGKNVIGAVVGPGWYKGELTWLGVRGLYGEHAALSTKLVVKDGSQSVFDLASDAGFRAAEGPILFAEIYHGERYDARLENNGWSEAGFDDSGWSQAVIREFDSKRVTPQDGPFVGMQERLPAVKLLTTPRGERVLDFGQNLTGWVEFAVKGKAGDRVVLSHAEILDAKGNFYTENLRSARARIEYILKGTGTETYAPHFTFHGFRFVQVEEYPGELDPSAFTAVVVHSRMAETLSFSCSEPLLNQLHHNILWGWKGNAFDVPTDCPQRDERLGWTGDAQVFIGTATYLTDSITFYRKWLRDLASEQRSDGGIPYVVPDALTGVMVADANVKDSHSSTGWGDAAVVCPWTAYERYADLDLLREQYPSMKAWVEFIRANAEKGLIWNTGFHFGDWVALDAKEGSYFGATPNDLTATAYYAYSARLLASAAGALGMTEDEAIYRKLGDAVAAAFRNEFITPSGRLAARTQTAHVLALVFRLVPEAHRERVTRDLVALLDENGGHLTTGFLGTPFICRALAENGRLDRAYALLLKEDFPSWLYQVKQGATTVWEHWDGMKPDGTMWSTNMNSFNHYAYGAIGEWIYGTIGGLSPDRDAPGFESVVLSPRPGGGLTHARTSYEGPYGPITLEWQRDQDKVHIELSIPPNSRARVVLHEPAAGSVTGSDGLRFADEAGEIAATAGSGSFRVDYRISPTAKG